MMDLEQLIPELEAVIVHGSLDRRVKALDHLTSVFLSAPDTFSETQIDALDEIFLRLCADIETVARRALAVRLSDRANAPIKTVAALANDDAIAVAGPILSRSPCVGDKVLIDIINSKSQEYLLAVSTRKSLPPDVTDALVVKGNREVVSSVAVNQGAQFSAQGFEMLVGRTEGDDELTLRVASRGDIPRYLYLELVKKASDAVRLKLAAAQPGLTQEIQQTVAEVAGIIRQRSGAIARDYAAAEQHIKTLQASGGLTPADIERMASDSRFEETAAALAALGHLPVEFVERALLQRQPELLVVMARAVGLTWPATKAVILLGKDESVVSAKVLQQALKNFERLKPSTAQLAVRYYALQKARAGD